MRGEITQEELNAVFKTKTTDQDTIKVLRCAIENFQTIGQRFGCETDTVFMLALAQLIGTVERLEK